MPLDICDPCCSPSSWFRKVDTFRQAELIILCQILEAIQGGGGGGGNPAPPDTSVQYNNGGVFGGDATFTFDNVSKAVHVERIGVDIGDGSQGYVHIDHNGIERVLYYSVTDDVDGNNVYQPTSWNVSKLSSPAGAFTLDGYLFDTIYSAENLNGSINGVLTGITSTATLFIPANNTWAAPNTAAFVSQESFVRIINAGNNDSASDFNLISHYFREPTTATIGIGNFTGSVQALSAFFEGDIQLNSARRLYFNGSYSEPNLVLGDTYVSLIGVSPNAELQWTIEGVSNTLRMSAETMYFGGVSEAHCTGGFSDFTMPDITGADQTFRNFVYNGGLTADGPLYPSGLFIEAYSNTNAAGAEVVAIVGKGEQRFAFPSIGVRGFGTGVLADNLGVQGIAVAATVADNIGVYGLAANAAGNNYGVYSDGDAFVDGKLTVTGGIDPTYLELAGLDTNTYLNMTDGQNVAVSAADEGRIRYNTALQIFEKSEDGAAWVPLSGTGAPSAPASSVQFNDGGTFGGSANFTFDDTNVVLTLDSGADGTIPTIRTPDGSGTNFGKQLLIITGAGDTNDSGGLLQLTAGDGNGTGNGGGLELYAGESGNGATGSGGTLVLFAGSSQATNGAGGQVQINAGGAQGTQSGGDVQITGGDSGGAGGTAGDVIINAGFPAGGTPGNVDVGTDSDTDEVNISHAAGKIGIYGTTADVQPTNAIAAAAFVANTSGIVDDSATFGGYTIGQVVAALQRIGALA